MAEYDIFCHQCLFVIVWMVFLPTIISYEVLCNNAGLWRLVYGTLSMSLWFFKCHMVLPGKGWGTFHAMVSFSRFMKFALYLTPLVPNGLGCSQLLEIAIFRSRVSSYNHVSSVNRACFVTAGASIDLNLCTYVAPVQLTWQTKFRSDPKTQNVL
jgi:hypothetical protein